ncbi:uncharacterized protein LOC132791053 [Drosophila nasuta]|uniref:uncharacterized protein LOC132791053 n=1 Tax=Drosophila nasuta TaxID=42062 RepID=UPI00295F17C1|nr:uncharacterized protein LOC132791053 [Drosophila nasuta]
MNMSNFKTSLMNLTVRPSIRVLVRRTRSTIIRTVNKYSRNPPDRGVVCTVKCRDCGNFIGRSNFDFLKRRQKLNSFNCEHVACGIFAAAISLILGYGLFLVRRYNQTFSYGSGGCQVNFLWPLHDCQVQI